MNKKLIIIIICLSIALVLSLTICRNKNQTNSSTPKQESAVNEETVELTLDNWENYLAYQEISDTTPVTTRNLYGFTLYESTGTYTINFYSKSNVKYENVSITVKLLISTTSYMFDEDKQSIALSDRTSDDWMFLNKSIANKEPNGYTTWHINRKGTLSNEGKISFSEPCKMNYIKKPIPVTPLYNSLEVAIKVSVTEISGRVIVNAD